MNTIEQLKIALKIARAKEAGKPVEWEVNDNEIRSAEFNPSPIKTRRVEALREGVGGVSHTNEPWHVVNEFAFDLVDSDGGLFASFNFLDDANRAVQCVNACAGIEDPAKAIEAAREALKTLREALFSDDIGVCRRADLLAIEALQLLTPSK